MLSSPRNIYCVGRNYKLHAEELGNEVPSSPMIFMKPTHSAVNMDGQVISLPGHLGEIHYEAELVVCIGQRYEKGMTAELVIESFALGVDLTLRDVQGKLKEKGHPWLQAKGFRNAAPITSFQKIETLSQLNDHSFSLYINDELKQRGHLANMIFNLQVLVDHIGSHYGLDRGDLIFTGTPEGVGQLNDGDRLALHWGDQLLGRCIISLN